MKRKYASELLEGIHESAQALQKVGAISEQKMKEFDDLCYKPDGSVTDIDPFAGLISSDYQSFAQQVGVSVSFVHKLINKNIIYSTIPPSFIQKALEIIGIHANQLIAYLSSDEGALYTNQDNESYLNNKLSCEDALESASSKNGHGNYKRHKPIING